MRDDDVSIAAPPKIHRLLSVDSKDRKSDCEEDHSSPGAFASLWQDIVEK